MPITKETRNGSRLGTRLRGKLADAYSARGHHTSSLWYVYSPRTDRDWVLSSSLEWSHFLLAESDPHIALIDYSPTTEVVRVGDDDHATKLDAVVTYKDGLIEWREIKHSDASEIDLRAKHQWEAQAEAALQKGVRYKRYTEEEIYSCPQKIANWSRVIAWLAAVRGRSLHLERIQVVTLLDAAGSASIGEIQKLGTSSETASLVAATLKGIQDGLFVSDLDKKPLSRNTLIKRVEGER